MNVFRTQNLNNIVSNTESSESKKLTLIDLILMSVGAVIGTGVMVLTGVAAAENAGPSIAISFVISGIVCMFVVLCYAELAASVPSSGASYTFVYVGLGEILAYITGVFIIVGYIVSIATVSAGWADYLVSLLKEFNVVIPLKFTTVPAKGGIINIPAILAILGVTAILSMSTNNSKKFDNVMVVIKLLVIGIFIVVGVFSVKKNNWHPFMPYGIKGIFTGTAAVFFAYSGFNATVSAAKDVKNPKRIVPLGLIISLIICALIYVAVSFVLTGMVKYTNLDVGDALSYALSSVGENLCAIIVSVGAILGILAVIFACEYSGSRILNQMSLDKLVPDFLGKENKKSIPITAVWSIGIISALMSGFINLSQLANIANASFLTVYILVCISTIVVRKKYGNNTNGFKTILFPFIPILAILGCLLIIFFIKIETWIYLSIVFGLSIISYFTYSYKHSLLNSTTQNSK